jgi:hypothetical protein
MEIGNAAAHIDGDLAAADEHLPELFPPALHARFHSGYRDALMFRRFGLRQPANRSEFDRGSVGLGQAPDHRGQAGCEFNLGLTDRSGVRFGRQVELQAVSSPVAALADPQRVPQSISRDLKKPRFGSIG